MLEMGTDVLISKKKKKSMREPLYKEAKWRPSH